MGKRVDFSARTVVSPDPNLYVDELGLFNLTFYFLFKFFLKKL